MFVGKISSSSHPYSLFALLWTERIEVRVVAIRPSSLPAGRAREKFFTLALVIEGEGRVRVRLS